MQYTTLGRTGVKVSRLCFGTMSFGGEADEQTSAAMFARCREAGINFFDCADVYNKGRSEEILGSLTASCRDELVLTTKVYAPMSDDPNDRGLSRRHILLAVENSLRRLRTDRIDLYFCHLFDASVAMEETLRAMDDLVRQGKVLHPAVSNWAAWQIERALGISAREHWARFECVQPMYNLVKRQAEVEILPMAAAESLGVIPYSPLGGGLLTGKYGVDRKPDAGRIVENKMYKLRYADPAGFEAAERLAEYAAERGAHPATVAVAWVMHHPAVTAPIIGARNLDQLEPSLAAADFEMTPIERRKIGKLSPEPPVATDRAEEKIKPMW